MKKKFSLWLNIATICLCLCAIAVGVYSAQNATLNVSGTVGFKAHNCKMLITNYKIENSSRKNGDTAVSPAFSDYLPSGASAREDFPTAGIEVTGATAVSFNTDKFYFVDDVEQNKVPDIIITFTIKNNSSFKVTATMTISEALTASTSGITVVDYTLTQGFDAKDGARSERDLTIRLSLSDPTAETLDFSSNQLFSVSFEKDDNANTYAPGEYYVEDGKLFVQYGYYPTTDEKVYVHVLTDTDGHSIYAYGDNNLGKPIRWVAFSTDGTSAISNLSSVPTSGTYYFVSEYVLSTYSGFNSVSSTPVNGKNPNDYAGSELRTYVNENLATDYLLYSLKEKATPRELPTEEITDFIMSNGSYHSDYEDGYIVDGKANAISGCVDELWVLSKSECELLETVFGTVCGYLPNKSEQLSGRDGEIYISVILRSPKSDLHYVGYYILSDKVSVSSIGYGLGGYIRPAFQIEIS